MEAKLEVLKTKNNAAKTAAALENARDETRPYSLRRRHRRSKTRQPYKKTAIHKNRKKQRGIRTNKRARIS